MFHCMFYFTCDRSFKLGGALSKATVPFLFRIINYVIPPCMTVTSDPLTLIFNRFISVPKCIVTASSPADGWGVCVVCTMGGVWYVVRACKYLGNYGR